MERAGLIRELERRAKELRKDILRMTTGAGSGHPGGSLSAADIVAVLYFHKMRLNPKKPDWPDRDRFIMSKGHCCPAQYAALSELGYFGKGEIGNLRKLGCILQGHPDMCKTPGVEINTGSLGQGLSVANGIALAGRIDRKDYRVYCVLGDGELQEGQVWEAAMSSSHYKLDSLVAIVDKNGLQIDGPTEEVMGLHSISDKFRAFGWNTMEIDGHSIGEILDALNTAEKMKGKPTLIVANTVKGKGVSFMEGQVAFHGKALDEEQLKKALKELA